MDAKDANLGLELVDEIQEVKVGVTDDYIGTPKCYFKLESISMDANFLQPSSNIGHLYLLEFTLFNLAFISLSMFRIGDPL